MVDFEQQVSRNAPFGGRKVVRADVETLGDFTLENMGIKRVNRGTFAVGRNREGFVIKLSRIIKSSGEQISDVELLEKAKKYFGVE